MTKLNNKMDVITGGSTEIGPVTAQPFIDIIGTAGQFWDLYCILIVSKDPV